MTKKVYELIILVVVAIILAVCIRTFVAEIYIVYGDSMLPNLHDGDKIMISKMIDDITSYQRGDIVVIDDHLDRNQNIVKRIIALPGDRIAIQDNHVFINGDLLEEPYLNNSTEGSYVEAVVPVGKFFVMGDNRSCSLDSRYSEIGFVEYTRFKGKAFSVVWPPANWQIITR